MTTIAYRDGQLAADRQCNNGGTVVGHRDKIKWISIGEERARIAMTGDLGTCLAIVSWLESGRKGPIPADAGKDQAGSVVVIPTTGDPIMIEFAHEHSLPDAPFWAWGVGRDLAMGAMHHGATAKEAVEAGIAFDLHTGGGVTVLEPEE